MHRPDMKGRRVHISRDAPAPPVAIVTGTSRGVGRGIAERLLDEGYVVYGCSRGAGELKHRRYRHEQVDLSSESRINEWVRGIHKACGRLDVILCNAAMSSTAPALLTTPQQLESMFRVNFFGVVALCRAAAKLMMPRRSGRIIAFSSIGVVMSDVGTSAYVASKSALEAYFKVLGRELAPFGITCNVIRISIVESEMTKALPTDAVQRVLDRVPVRRFATVDDVYNLVRMVANPEGEYVNGAVLSLGFDG